MTPVFSHRAASAAAQRGVAIITTMLMVTLATIAVTAMVTQQRLDIYRTGNRLANVQLKTLALAGERFAVQQLHLDHRNAERGDSDSFEDDWATPTPPYPIEGATISGCVVDMQGRFNLNNLVGGDGQLNTEQRDVFARLLQALDIDPVKAAAVVDWLDADANIINADGGEDDYYTQLAPPYLTANRHFASLSELKLVKGFNLPDDSEDYETLLPHISVLPVPTRINVNTATPAVLQSLAGFVDAAKADELSHWADESWSGYPKCAPFDSGADETLGVAQNTSENTANDDGFYETLDAFIAEINSERTNPDDVKFENEDLIAVQSDYFEVNVAVELDDIDLSQRSLLQRDENGIVTVLLRVRGDNLLQISGK